MTREIELHVHSYSLRFHLRHREVTGYDVFSYIDEMAGLGMTGVNVSANGPGLRDLCGSDADHFRAVRAAVAGYMLQQWNVDCSPNRRLDPMIHRLSLKDLESLKNCKSAAIAPGFSNPDAPG